MKRIAIALALGCLAAPAMAEQQVYPFKTHENFCPNGLQPVYAGGEICCGKPTTHMTYAQVMQHPAPRRHAPRRVEYIPAEKGIPTHKGLD
ncbi:hypothetical protein SAMN04488012_104188 [Palleronia salina]|uniref:Uncharacterized protein n=1 Tax=Palleronia salina TaxID=313368 RepID=A0A1M6G3Q8_9RHOB|nr:hypothetical protein [Palleronia salina]SHJ04611.1 hypothetical protein SAMN04488012_104188 [Palleronia salina]